MEKVGEQPLTDWSGVLQRACRADFQARRRLVVHHYPNFELFNSVLPRSNSCEEGRWVKYLGEHIKCLMCLWFVLCSSELHLFEEYISRSSVPDFVFA